MVGGNDEDAWGVVSLDRWGSGVLVGLVVGDGGGDREKRQGGGALCWRGLCRWVVWMTLVFFDVSGL